MKLNKDIRLIIIDCFCGAGGYTEGVHRAMLNGKPCTTVIIGINHDDLAIKSHQANHPETNHFTEDFTKLNPRKLSSIVKCAKFKYSNALVLFHMSAECTHHSRANGGRPRDADSRSLAEYAYKYIDILRPDIISVENVREFLTWGPLNENGHPIPDMKGLYYDNWVYQIKKRGYSYEYKLLNAADYGAYTSRIRYFGLFALNPRSIAWPKQTHSKNPVPGLQKWNAVKDVLQLCIEGKSIFERKKPLVDATLKRIYAGLVKFVAGGKDNYQKAYNSIYHPFVALPFHVYCHSENKWLLKYNSVNGKNGKHIPPSIENPSPVVSCQGRLGLINVNFLAAYYGNGHNVHSTDKPAPTITTKDRCALIESQFIDQQYGKSKPASMNSPINTLTANPKYNLIFLDKQYGTGVPQSIEKPASTTTCIPKLKVVQCDPWLMDTQFHNIGRSINDPMGTITANRKHFYLMNPQYKNKGGSIHTPCFTLIARMDKSPPYLINAENGHPVSFTDTDTPIMRKIKVFMRIYGISDIKMRMLTITELKRIMGFKDNYVLKGTKTNMKKFIGNAVECTQAKVNIEAIAATIKADNDIKTKKMEGIPSKRANLD